MQLLATVSAAVLVGVGTPAYAGDTDRPIAWLEIGWHYEASSGGEELFEPSFAPALPPDGFVLPGQIEDVHPWTYGVEGKLSFQPKSSDWIFSAAVRYGRAQGHKALHQQTAPAPITGRYVGPYDLGTGTPIPKFSETIVKNSESHAILDFKVGKDVGLGLFGRSATSILSAGVRFSEMKFGSHSEIKARPDVAFPQNGKYPKYHHDYFATNDQNSSFKGWGPTVTWDATELLAGNAEEGAVKLDWSINAGVLFGKQRTSGYHQTKTHYEYAYLGGFIGDFTGYHDGGKITHSRSHTVTVPNLGGSLGLSYNWTNAKISLGYRADMFFNAIDGGIDTRKTYNKGFYGPYAAISIGLGG